MAKKTYEITMDDGKVYEIDVDDSSSSPPGIPRPALPAALSPASDNGIGGQGNEPGLPAIVVKGLKKLVGAIPAFSNSPARGVSNLVQGAAETASPLAIPALIGAPEAALMGGGLSYLLGKGAGGVSDALGASPDTTQAVEDVAGLVGGGVGGKLGLGTPGAVVKGAIQGGVKAGVEPLPVDGPGYLSHLLRLLPFPIPASVALAAAGAGGGRLLGGPEGEVFGAAGGALAPVVKGAVQGGKRALSDIRAARRVPPSTPDYMPAAPGGAEIGPGLPPDVDTSAVPKVSLPSGREPGSIANAISEAKPVKTWKKLDLKQFSNLQKSLKPESPRPAAPGGGLPGELPSGRAPGGIQNQTAPPEMPAPPPNLRPKVPAVPGRTWKGAPAAAPEPTDTPVPVVKVPKNVQALLDKLSPEHKAVVEEALKQEPAAPVEDLIQPDTAAPDIPEHMQDASRPDIRNEFHQRNRLDLVRDIHHELRSTGVTLKNLKDIQSSPAASKNFWDAMGYKLGKKLSPETIQHAIDDYEGPGPRAFSRGLLPNFATANSMTPEEAQSQLEADGWKVA